MEANPGATRAYCYRCMRVQAVCLCNDLELCHNRTEVHVLQHRKERKHAFGTVRLLKIGLANLRIHDLHTDIGQRYPEPRGFPKDAGVLYPGKGSVDLESLTPEQMPSKLVVIDGTWSQAHRIYRDNPWLRRLPCYGLSPASPSRYRIRKEPSAECLSTLESTVMALSVMEPETEGIGSLLHAFDLMNERQVLRMQQNRGGPKRFKEDRVRPMRAVPHALWAEPERIVVVYGESDLPHHWADKKRRALIQWSAIRLSEPKLVFDKTIATANAVPCGRFLQELGWRPEDIARALPLEQVGRAFADFLRPRDIVVAWNKGTLRLGRQHRLLEQGIVLKEIYGNTTQRNFGTLDDVMEHDGLTATPVPRIAGRAQGRLANAHAAALGLGRWARDRQGCL